MSKQIIDQNVPAADEGTLSKPQSRRQWLRAASGAAVLLPVVHLTGCGNEPSEAAQAPATPTVDAAADKVMDVAGDAAEAASDAVETAANDAAQAVEEAADAAQEAVAEAVPAPGAGGLSKISEDDATAKALSYVHDAGSVDQAKQPRFAAGQNCLNCAQFQANDAEAGWGGCAIFPGKLVAEAGWCAGYVAAS